MCSKADISIPNSTVVNVVGSQASCLLLVVLSVERSGDMTYSSVLTFVYILPQLGGPGLPETTHCAEVIDSPASMILLKRKAGFRRT